jgi:trimethylamine:corrinoid methyltransferase-like protein
LKETGSERHFLAQPHTVGHMRSEFFFPTLANREKRAAYRPDDNTLARAKASVAEIRGAPQESRLHPEVRQKILDTYPEIVR